MGGIIYKNIGLPTEREEKIEQLLEISPHNPPTLEDMWELMDHVWDNYGCNNKNLDWKKVREFYNHPVWILNGLFVEQHELSMQHRHAITDWIVRNRREYGLNTVIDYGGGFGTLARLIAKKKPGIQITIYEPQPSDFATKQAARWANISFLSTIDREYGKRVVNIKDDIVTINNIPVSSYTFKKDYYFMMGDSRDNSMDSRFWGLVARDMVVGQAFITLLSWDRNIPFSQLFKLLGSIRLDRVLKLLH